MFELTTKFNPAPPELAKEIAKDVEELARSVIKEVVRTAPALMKGAMSDNPPSLRGHAPAKVTGELFNSIEGDEESLEISMAFHAFYLDPVFEGEPGGGGYLDRPFILPAIAKSLEEIR